MNIYSYVSLYKRTYIRTNICKYENTKIHKYVHTKVLVYISISPTHH